MTEASDIIERLGLRPLPVEGGYFTETWGGDHFSSIYYLLAAPGYSAWHRLDRDEVYAFHAGSALTVHLLGPGGYRSARLGTDLRAGERPQLVVPAGTWQASETAAWSLVGTVVVPPYTDECVEFGTPSLVADRPELARLLPAAP
ncbi:cupin domain-containing protein [Actinokineospora auranticolor]|nr:cupin domain-containing protein [Actinokineospora auranticolor]